MQLLDDNYQAVCQRIEAACKAAGRREEDVRLLAVSKKQLPDTINAVAGLGQRAFGENRVQEAAQKIELCASQIELASRWSLAEQ